MRKLLMIILLFAAVSSQAQVKVSELPTYTGTPAGGWVPIVVGGITRKMDAGRLANPDSNLFATTYWSRLTFAGKWDSVIAKEYLNLFFQTKLAYVPLNSANNLSDLTNIAVARGNLGLLNGALYDTSHLALMYQSKLFYTPLNTANNLSDVSNIVTARANLNAVGVENNETITGVKTFNNGIWVDSVFFNRGAGVKMGSISIGDTSLTSNTTGNFNTSVGHNSLVGNTTGYYNVSMGASSLRKNTTGYYNTSVGTGALWYNTIGWMNTALGAYSLYDNTTGTQNSAFGYLALGHDSTGWYNTGIGAGAMEYNSAGSQNVAVGNTSLQHNSGSYNTALGRSAAYTMQSGDNNVFVGSFAASALRTGNSNIVIGANVNAPSDSVNNYLNIGGWITGSNGAVNVPASLNATLLMQGNDTVLTRSLLKGNNGIATLDQGGKVPISQLPSSLMIYKGIWDAGSNTPFLNNSIGVAGWVYQISNYGIGSYFGVLDTFYVGDYLMYNGTSWEVSSNTNTVRSVNGQQGVVSLSTSNITEGTNYYWNQTRFNNAFTLKNTDNLTEGSSHLYFTNARAQAAINVGGSLSYTGGVISYTTPTLYYQTVAANNSTISQRPTINFSSAFSVSDDIANNSTKIDMYQATASTNGWLSHTDFSSFSAKVGTSDTTGKWIGAGWLGSLFKKSDTTGLNLGARFAMYQPLENQRLSTTNTVSFPQLNFSNGWNGMNINGAIDTLRIVADNYLNIYGTAATSTIQITARTGNIYTAGIVSALSFSGAGTGLTGMASSLTAGAATNWGSSPNCLTCGVQGADGSMNLVGIRGDGTALRYSANAVQTYLGLGSAAYYQYTGLFVGDNQLPTDLNNMTLGFAKYHPAWTTSNSPNGNFGTVMQVSSQSWVNQLAFDQSNSMYMRKQTDGSTWSSWLKIVTNITDADILLNKASGTTTSQIALDANGEATPYSFNRTAIGNGAGFFNFFESRYSSTITWSQNTSGGVQTAMQLYKDNTSPSQLTVLGGIVSQKDFGNSVYSTFYTENTNTGSAAGASYQMKTGISSHVWQMFLRNDILTFGIQSLADLVTINSSGQLTASTFNGNLDWSYITSKPTLPTTLPASDVYSWAKQSTKPSYAWSEITTKPNFSLVATSGAYSDLSGLPDLSHLNQVNTATGNKSIGDVPSGGGASYLVDISSLGFTDNNYFVTTQVISLKTAHNEDNTVTVAVWNKTASNFEIHVQEWTGQTQNISIDWMVTRNSFFNPL